MFAVGKGPTLPNGSEVQRIIMNLIPSNAGFRHAQGGTSDLPSITQYLSFVLHGDERLVFFQSDMTSAFYLFKIPQKWHRMMAFNVCIYGGTVRIWSWGALPAMLRSNPNGMERRCGGHARDCRAFVCARKAAEDSSNSEVFPLCPVG